jgi:hypothetical protein
VVAFSIGFQDKIPYELHISTSQLQAQPTNTREEGMDKAGMARKETCLLSTASQKVSQNCPYPLLINHYAMKTSGGNGCTIHVFLTSALEVSFTPRPLYSRGKSTRYTLDRSLGVPQNRYGRSSLFYRDSNSSLSVLQFVANHYTDWAIPAPMCSINSEYTAH